MATKKVTATVFLSALLLAGFSICGYAQPKDRVAVKNILDGFKPSGTLTKSTVAELEKIPLIKVGNHTARLTKEKKLIQITGIISKMQKEADGDIHCEVTDGSIKDSTVACEFPDPLKAKKSPFASQFATARRFILGKKVGDKVTLSGILFQDKFHSPSPKRIRNFLEIHPVLQAE